MSVLRLTKDFDAAKSRMKCEPILMNKQAANKSMWNLSVKNATDNHDLNQVVLVVATLAVVVKSCRCRSCLVGEEPQVPGRGVGGAGLERQRGCPLLQLLAESG